MELSGNDLDAVTRTMMAEAGPNSTPASQAAVANVILNRMAAGGTQFGGTTPYDLVHAPNQFEPWNPGSGNDPRRFPSNSPAYQQAQELAKGVFNGTVQDHTNGATYFYAPRPQAELGRATPSFAKGNNPLAEIGGHQFFGDPKSGPVSSEQIASITGGGGPAGPGFAQAQSQPPGASGPGQPSLSYAANGQPQLDRLSQLIQSSRPGGAGGGGGLLGQLMFGRQGIMGLFPDEIQQKGIFGSLLNGLGGNQGIHPSLGLPSSSGTPLPDTGALQASLGPPVRPVQPQGQAPPPLATPSPASPTSPSILPVPPAAMSPSQAVVPGQGNPHLPGFDPSSVPFINTPVGGGRQGALPGGPLPTFALNGGGGGNIAGTGSALTPSMVASALPLAPKAPLPVMLQPQGAGGAMGGGLGGLLGGGGGALGGGGGGLGGLLGALFG